MSSFKLIPAREAKDDIQEHIKKWMSNLGLTNDVFQDSNLWSCDGCGCIFNIVADYVIYLDRYVYASDSAEENCGCHDTPKWIGYDVGSVCWYTPTPTDSSWLCGTASTNPSTFVKCSLCNDQAIVFLNLPFLDGIEEAEGSGPLWSCWNHLGTSPYDEKKLFQKYATEEEKKSGNNFSKILPYLKEEPEELKKIRETIEIFISLNGGVKRP